jgi:general secretion pathway protein B
MSLILEALKKSEDKRRLGAAPDLATPFSAPRRRNWVWPIAALLVAVGLIAWALRPSSPPPPTATAAPPKSNASTVHAVPTPGQKTGAPLHSVTGNNDVAPTPPPENLPKAGPSPDLGSSSAFVYGQPGSNAVAPAGENRRATMEAARDRRRAAQANNQPAPAIAKTPAPPASRTKSVAAPPIAPPPPASPPVNAKTVTAAPPIAASAPVAPPAPAAAPAASIPAPPASTPSRAPKSTETVGLTPPSAPTTATPPTKAASAASSAQPYAELPFSVRKSLPELRLSMHVYGADPSHRFVVLNDSRLTEGEKTGDEIFVREIRPDGVVLEFQSQRFFYPRDGL